MIYQHSLFDTVHCDDWYSTFDWYSCVACLADITRRSVVTQNLVTTTVHAMFEYVLFLLIYLLHNNDNNIFKHGVHCD